METTRRPSTREPASEGIGYVVYTLTPNMWEAPWVRHLLSALPVSRHEVLDLWSPPPERARVRRLQIRLESLLPGPLRPTQRMLRRKVKPERPSVFVYNTWGLDHAVRLELGRLLSRFRDVGIVSVDEPMRDSRDTYTSVAFGVRVGFAAEKYRGAENLLVAPLGVPKTFVRAQAQKKLEERSYSWAFLGELKNTSRQSMVRHLEQVQGESFVHATSTWNSDDELRGGHYSGILTDTIFAPSPRANVHLECYRTYEALECGAIPVVDTDYYRAQFDAPLPVVQPTWEDAPAILNRFLEDRSALEQLDEQCRQWWQDVKQAYPRKVRALVEDTDWTDRPQPSVAPATKR